MLVCSEELLAELGDVLARPRIKERIPQGAAGLFSLLYAQKAVFLDPGPPPQVCRDPNDDYLLSLAVAGAADYLVTRDEDLLVLTRHGTTELVYPARFLQILSDRLRSPRADS